MSIKTSLSNFGVKAVDPSSLPSDATASDLIDMLANLKGMPIVYLGTSLSSSVDSVATNPVRPTTQRTTALASSLVAKATAGWLIEARGQNESAVAQYIQIHDSASLPVNGSVPKEVIKVSAGSPFSITPISHLQFTEGIVICNSTTAATLTLGAANCWFSVDMEV